MINTLYSRYANNPSPYNREVLFLAILQLAQSRLNDEDRAQTATMTIFKGLSKYKPDKPFLHWVNQILKYNYSDGQQVSNKRQLCYLVLEGHTLTTAAMTIGISYPAAVMRLKRLGNKLSSEKTASYS
jgi:hypothetical protein